jgi:hypothetical protein
MILPLVAIMIIPWFWRRFMPCQHSFRSGLSEAWIFAGGGCIGLLFYWLAMHQCEEVSLSLDLFLWQRFSALVGSGRFDPVFIFMGIGLLALVIGLPQLSLPARRMARLHDWSASKGFSLVLLALTTLGTVAVYMLMEIDPIDVAHWRYLLVPAFLLPLLISLILQEFAESTSRRSPTLSSLKSRLITAFRDHLGLVPWQLGMGLLLACVVVLISACFDLVSSLARVYSAELAAESGWILGLLKRNHLEDRVGFVADPPWESRKIDVITAGKVKSFSVSNDGNPRIFPHSRFQFLRQDYEGDPKAPKDQDVVSPGWVLASPINFDRMIAFYGKPVEVLGCFRGRGCMYRFDESKVNRNTAIFLSTWHDDLYGCLNEPDRDLRANMIRFVRRVPGVRTLVFPAKN